MARRKPLKFKVAPHLVEDLGLNLYTTLSRVIVEYVANAYDADSELVNVTINAKKIRERRKALKEQWQAEMKAAEESGAKVTPLEERTLPNDCEIVIEDFGCGMNREDLRTKFLIAGRRRRKRDNTDVRTPGQRIVMGRKGLGKLAGFGAAERVVIETRPRGTKQGLRIELRYDQILEANDGEHIPVNESRANNLPGVGRRSGYTRVTLSQLKYEPAGMDLKTIGRHLADHFLYLKRSDFAININEEPAPRPRRKFAFAWPSPELKADDLVAATIKTDSGRSFDFEYRMRFTEEGKALQAKDRGVRVYAHDRLASAPSLLDADTNMHGFRMTDYLDGVVVANFIDDQPSDYIATDRQSLRWETPLLQPLNAFLSEQIKEACREMQAVRDEDKRAQAAKDKFTAQVISGANLTKKEEGVARRMGAALASLHPKGFKDPAYRTQFSEVVTAMSRGELMAKLTELAKDPDPDLKRVVEEVTRLTAEQLDGYQRYIRGRLSGIEALKKIVDNQNFSKRHDERELHTLLKKNPWLINPQYFHLVTSDRTAKSMYSELERELQISDQTPEGYDPTAKKETEPGGTNDRPDLAFLLGNQDGSTIVIVELKAPNTPLHMDHLLQLQRYIKRTKKWLQRRDKSGVVVTGILIGSIGPIESRAQGVEDLENAILDNPNHPEWIVKSIGALLDDSAHVHQEILAIADEQATADKTSEEPEHSTSNGTPKRGRNGVANLPRNLRRKPVKPKAVGNRLKSRSLT